MWQSSERTLIAAVWLFRKRLTVFPQQSKAIFPFFFRFPRQVAITLAKVDNFLRKNGDHLILPCRFYWGLLFQNRVAIFKWKFVIFSWFLYQFQSKMPIISNKVANMKNSNKCIFFQFCNGLAMNTHNMAVFIGKIGTIWKKIINVLQKKKCSRKILAIVLEKSIPEKIQRR